jgi:predicted transcriptional regulator
VSELLDLLQVNDSEVPKVIQELYGKSFIFRFKLNERNLTEGRQRYLVTRTFIPNDVLDEKFKNDQNNKVRDIFSCS